MIEESLSLSLFFFHLTISLPSFYLTLFSSIYFFVSGLMFNMNQVSNCIADKVPWHPSGQEDGKSSSNARGDAAGSNHSEKRSTKGRKNCICIMI